KEALFPRYSWVWEFNYRGSLEFLERARAQQHERELVIEDGWRYFIHGWSQVIGEVFDIAMTPQTVARLSEAADPARTGGPCVPCAVSSRLKSSRWSTATSRLAR